MSRNKRGQSTLEYVIIWTAIVAAVLVGAKTFLQPKISDGVSLTSQKIGTEVERLTKELGK